MKYSKLPLIAFVALATFTAGQAAWLNRIFPSGVCDYSRGDQGRPAS